MYRILITILLLFLTACQELPVETRHALSLPERGMTRLKIENPATIKKRVALVIGNANYEFAPLNNPVNDAKDMAKALRSVGFYVIENHNASWEQMDTSIGKFEALLGKGVVGLFYFSGHGVQLGNKNYLLPTDMVKPSVRKVKHRSISASYVLTAMEAADNTMNILILDACRDNPFKGFKGLSKSLKRGLARIEHEPTGTLIAYATAPGDTAADGYGRNSPYTAGLLAYLREPNLPIESMFRRVRNVVKKKTNNRQTPWEFSSLEGDDFYFVASASNREQDAEIARLKREKAEAEAKAEREHKARIKAERRGTQKARYQAKPVSTTDVPKNKRTDLGLYLTSTETFLLLNIEGQRKKTLFIDVRTKEEYDHGRPTLVDDNVPKYNMDENKKYVANPDYLIDVADYLEGKGLNKESRIILICREGHRSRRAVDALAKEGYKNVYNVIDGTDGWRSNKLPWLE